MLDATTAQILVSFLNAAEPNLVDQLRFEDEQCIVLQDDWTGYVQLDDWEPATGETISVEDHVRELAQKVDRLAAALSEFGIDAHANAVAEAFMKRTAPTQVAKRKLNRK